MALNINGRFFEHHGEPFFVNAVTYGPFPPDKGLDASEEFPRIAQAGFNAIRTYETPSREFLDLAEKNQLLVFPTVPWHWDSLFTENPETLRTARQDLTLFLRRQGCHPALGAFLLANEIRPDLVRFMGPLLVRDVLEDLIDLCKELCPDLPVGYANFPTTEYLEPRNADFTAFNVYLEQEKDFRDYLRRLHNIAGDRPVLLTEFGFNTCSPPDDVLSCPQLEEQQGKVLTWAYRIARDESTAGFTTYSWSDRWFNGGREISDWSFGLTRRDGLAKPALAALSVEHRQLNSSPEAAPLYSIAICTRNGALRLEGNLTHFTKIEDPNYELLIIDDGSTDRTKEVVDQFIADTDLPCRLVRQEPSGLSAARNRAAREATGEVIIYIDDDARPHPLWLRAIREAFARNPRAAAAGGPNLAPIPQSRQNAIVTACDGNASHILFTDTTAEHLPGCNLALCRELLLEEGGFDKIFHAAGDDVDVCWRLLDAGHELAFHPAACVFHDRRANIKGFLRQQRGYGEAEALLYQKHPKRFGSDGIRWQGFIYSGAPMTVAAGALIHHGEMGGAPFQMLYQHQMPVRLLHRSFRNGLNKRLVGLTNRLASSLRRKTRKSFRGPSAKPAPAAPSSPCHNQHTRRDYSLSESDPRSRVLQRLLEGDWQISADEEAADLHRGPLQLLFAQTPLPEGNTILHLKLIQPPIEVTEPLSEIEEIINGSQTTG